MATDVPTAVDLFSGAGGFTLGLQNAGYQVLAATDLDPACAATYTGNLPGRPFVRADIRHLSGTQLAAAGDFAPDDLDLLVAGPPCQGYSIIGRRVVHDPRNDLFRDLLRVVGELRPRATVIENVSGLADLADGAYLRHILEGCRELGYTTAFAELLAAQYGAPQMRWRMIIIAFRRDLDIPAGAGFPVPIRGTRGIGELIPHCTIPPEDTSDFVTTREAIADLPRIGPGERADVYGSTPHSPYQQAMREGLGDELYNHYAARLSPQNIARIEALKPGQDWRDLPFEMLPGSMRRAKLKDHTRRYRRMTWDAVPRAIITRFRDPKTGEYTHPEQNRTLSIREAARIQGFPDRFAFHGLLSEQYEQVGNAVPVQVAEAVGRAVVKALDGTSNTTLENPFLRRPSILRAGLEPIGY